LTGMCRQDAGGTVYGQDSMLLFQSGGLKRGRVPRALPWAKGYCTFGAKSLSGRGCGWGFDSFLWSMMDDNMV